MAESSQGDSLNEGKTSDVRRREQCVLMSLWKKLAEYNYDTGRKSPYGDDAQCGEEASPENTDLTPQLYSALGGGREYDNFSILEGNPIDILHTLIGDKDLHKAYNRIKPVHLSSLVPKIRIYKVYQDLDAEGHPVPDKSVDIEMAFSDHSAMTRDSIFYDMKSRGDDVGIKSFSLSFLGVNEAEVENNIECSLSLFFRSLSDMDAKRPIPANKAKKLKTFDIMKKRTGPPSDPGSTEGVHQTAVSYKYTDLLIPPGAQGSKSRVALDGTMQHNPYSYRIKAEIGWAYPEGKETVIGSTDGGKDILEAVKSSTKSLLLTMTSHSFLFEDDGTIKLTINFIGAIESLLKSNRADMLFTSERISKEIRSIDARIRQTRALIGQNPSSQNPANAGANNNDDNARLMAQVDEPLSAGKLAGESDDDITSAYTEADDKFKESTEDAGSGDVLKEKLKALKNLRHQLFTIARKTLYSNLMENIINNGAVHTVNVHTAMLHNPGRYMRENMKPGMQGTIQPVYKSPQVFEGGSEADVDESLRGPGQFFAGNIPIVDGEEIKSGLYSSSPIEGTGISLDSLRDFIMGDNFTTATGKQTLKGGQVSGGNVKKGDDRYNEFTKFSDYGGEEALSKSEIENLVQQSFNLDGAAFGKHVIAGEDEYKALDGGLKYKQELVDDEISDIDRISNFRDLLTPRRFNTTTSPQTRMLHGENQTAGQVFINFLFLGDIIDAILGSVDKKVRDEVEIILGPIMFRDMTNTFKEEDASKEAYGKVSIISLADVPISLNLFMEWILKEIVAPQHEVLPFLQLLRNSITKLLFESLSVSCSPVRFENARLSTAFPSLSAISIGGNRENPSYESVIMRGTRQNIVDVRDLIVKAQKTPNKASSKTTQYMYLYADTSQPHFLSGNPSEDKHLGINHFFIGADSGLVKSIKFQKIDQPEYRNLRITQANQNSDHFQDILKEPYNATIYLVGNMLFYPGMRIYINPTLVGAGSSKKDGASLSRRLGLGGYYIITKVECEVSANDFETVLQCHFETFGEPEAGGTENSIRTPQLVFPTQGVPGAAREQIDKANRTLEVKYCPE